MKKIFWIVLLCSFAFIQCKQDKEVDLKGTWSYKLDKEGVGLAEKWFDKSFDDSILLPGALRDYGIGEIPGLSTQWTGSIYDSSWFFNPEMEKYRTGGNMKFPFWLTPETLYVGQAWYQREIIIPDGWSNKTVKLILERPHWQTKVWIDTLCLGNQNSLSTPHIYSFETGSILPGKHLLTVCVDNAIHELDPGINSHSISDHTQGNWNGIVGELKMFAQSELAIEQVKITPDVKSKKVLTKIELTKATNIEDLSIKVKINGLNHAHKVESKSIDLKQNNKNIDVAIDLGDEMKLWSEFEPNLYEMEIQLFEKQNELDVYSSSFGMREFGITDKRFTINGKQTFLRGTTDCCVFPLTGYPPCDEKEWTRIFKVCQSFGLNHMRFHSYCPPEAAFKAADKAGIYLQVEGPSWAKYSTSLGYGKPIDQYLMDETKSIIDSYGNHPSFVMMAYGNEPSGRYVAYLENWVDHFRNYDPQRLFTGASTGGSWHIIENSDFIVRAPPRGLEWKNRQPESEFDYRDKTENLDQPYVTFEMGQWCVFPNFEEIEKYSGPLKARNFELFEEHLSDKGMADQAHDFLMASGKTQASCYKQEIEATLRTPNLAGFQLLSLNDFSGQGTALVGVVDAFWDEKGYISGSEFKQFCNSVVPLARLPKFTFQNNDTLKATIELANFSGATLNNPKIEWQLIATDSSVVRSGFLQKDKVSIGNAIKLGNITLPLDFINEATQFKLQLRVNKFANDWNIWVYPEVKEKIDIQAIHVCDKLNDKAIQVLNSGGKVLLEAAGKVENGKDVVQYFTPVFWNTSWFRMRPPHTTGMLIQNEHPVFDQFPTDYYSDMQWWELANRQQVMNLEFFPEGFRPIVQPIDTWFLNRRLGMLFEANVTGGKLMVCSIDLQQNNDRPVAKYLKKCIIDYMNSDAFNPETELELEIIQELFEKKERSEWNSYVRNNP